jgi:hypothetical protein
MDLAQLVNGPGTRAVAEANQRLVDATSADNECEHGALPGDPGLSCGCWSSCPLALDPSFGNWLGRVYSDASEQAA